MKIPSQIEVELDFPIALDDDKSISVLKVRRPDAGMIADFILLLGGEEIFSAIGKLIFGGELQGVITKIQSEDLKGAEKELARKLGTSDVTGIAKTLGSMIDRKRFDMAFALLGEGCGHPGEVMRRLAPEDLYKVIMETAPRFFPKAFSQTEKTGDE